MICDLRKDLESLLERIPAEMRLDLSETTERFQGDVTVKKRMEDLLKIHPERDRILEELFGCGPLQKLLDDENVTEIIVNGPDAIWFETAGRFHRHDDVFLSPFTLSQFVQKICMESRLRLDLNQPFADGSWRGLRVHLAQAPLVSVPHSICLRRHPRYQWTLERLMQNNWASPCDLEILTSLLRMRKNFLVVGPTGAGKTSVLSALLAELEPIDRAIVIEDTDEIQVGHDLSTKMLVRRESLGALKAYDQAELVKQSLRMRPHRLIVGEVRGGEAKDLLLALSTGHAGSLGTLHAHSPRQALLRLEMLVQMGAPEWSLDTIRKLILLSVDALVMIDMQAGHRRLEGIYKICSLEKVGFLIEKMTAPQV